MTIISVKSEIKLKAFVLVTTLPPTSKDLPNISPTMIREYILYKEVFSSCSGTRRDAVELMPRYYAENIVSVLSSDALTGIVLQSITPDELSCPDSDATCAPFIPIMQQDPTDYLQRVTAPSSAVSP
jgi:hypothetical protein